MILILAMLLGLITGIGFGGSIFQIEKPMSKIFGLSVITAIYGGINYALTFHKETNPNMRLYFAIVFILFEIIGCIIYIYIALLVMKRDSTFKSYGLSSLDFLIGRKDAFKQYGENKQKDIDIKFKDRENQIKEIDKKIQNLEHREKIISTEEKRLLELKKNIEDNKNEGINLHLPLGNYIPINKSFVNSLDINIRRMINFAKEIAGLNDKFYNAFKNKKKLQKDDKSLEHLIVGYVLQFSNSCVNNLFDNFSTRIHYRYYDEENSEYKEFFTLENGQLTKAMIRAIKETETNMISESGRVKRSLIKSLNLKYHQGEIDSKWQNYITIPLENQINSNKIPKYSITISVMNASEYENTLYLINFCDIGIMINEFFKEIEEVVGIDILSDLRKIVKK